MIWLTRPALRTEDFFVAVGRLAQEGKLTAKGAGNPLLGAALLHRFRDEFRPTSPPPVVQPVVLGRWRSWPGCSGSGREVDAQRVRAGDG